MVKTEKYGPHRVVTKLDGTLDLVYCKNRIETWYTQRENRYYREEESNNVRNMGNVLRRISSAKFEEIHRSIVAAGAMITSERERVEMAMSKEESEWFHVIQKQNYDYAIADGIQGKELEMNVKSYALGLIQHIIDEGDTSKKTLEGIKLALRSERIISGWITAKQNISSEISQKPVENQA